MKRTYLNDHRMKWPSDPEMFDQVVYPCTISGCTVVTFEWAGLLGWVFVNNE